VAQQELAQPVTSAQLIALGGQARAHQVTQRLVRRIGHPHRGQIPRAEAARELRGIASIGLDPIAGFHRYHRRGHHLAAHAQLRELPVQHVAGGPRLVAHPQLLGFAEFADQSANRLGTVRDDPKAAHFTVRLCYGHRDRLRMDIQAYKSYVLHRRLPFVCGSAPRVFPIHSVIRELRIGSRSFHGD
jgi:hypothetical protein